MAANALPADPDIHGQRLREYLVRAAAFVTALEAAQAGPATDDPAWTRVSDTRMAAIQTWDTATRP